MKQIKSTEAMPNERITDLFIANLLQEAKIEFTPNGSLIVEVKKALKSASKRNTGKAGFPEFIGLSNGFLLVIEDKADSSKQVLYLDSDTQNLDDSPSAISDYAVNGAVHYAKVLIAKTAYKKIFAFGCSGDAKHHNIQPVFVTEEGCQFLPEIENFENFAPENIERYYREQVLGETPPEEVELEDILKKSKELHEDLRNYGKLGDSEKPLVVSAILLALCDSTFKIESLQGDTVRTDGQIIYDALSTYMERVKVTPSTKKDQILHQFEIVRDRDFLNKKHAKLEKTPLRSFTEYLKKNVLDLVRNNSPEDVLGRFYGQFIRYSGGDGQTLGVVLTPAHITDLFCELLNIQPSDIVFDPCCGTGSFLIAAMHHMLAKARDKKSQKSIKKEQLHGMEAREDMFSIATTNMILRGDGKSNLECGDFLAKDVKAEREGEEQKGFTIGLMNPPYSQAKNGATADLSEIHFVQHLLDSMGEGGRVAVIVPQSTMVGKSSLDKKIKAEILKKHTLEGVITLNKNTFYGIGTNACIAIFTAYRPHPQGKRCKFINFENDGYVVRKHIGLVPTQLAKEKRKQLLDCWLNDADAESKFMVKTTVEPDDEWLHSFYYFNDEIPSEADFVKTMADYLTFEFNMITHGRGYLFGLEDAK